MRKPQEDQSVPEAVRHACSKFHLNTSTGGVSARGVGFRVLPRPPIGDARLVRCQVHLADPSEIEIHLVERPEPLANVAPAKHDRSRRAFITDERVGFNDRASDAVGRSIQFIAVFQVDLTHNPIAEAQGFSNESI